MDRLTIFSDAVVAIAITLLAIDLPVPTGHSMSQFWSSVRQNSGHYAAFFISFVAIAAAWGHHHDIFRLRPEHGRAPANVELRLAVHHYPQPLCHQVVNQPSVTQSLGVHALQFGFYALVQALNSAGLLAILHHMVTHSDAPGMPASVVTTATWQSVGTLVGFGLSIPVFFATRYGWALWFAGPLVVQQVYRARHRARPKPAGRLSPRQKGSDIGD